MKAPRTLTRARPSVRAAAGIALAVVVLAVFVALTGGRTVLVTISRADPWLVLLGGVTGVAAIACWGESLRHVLQSTTSVGGLRYRFAYFSGDLARQTLPMGRLSGSAIIGYAIAKPFELPYEESLAAVTVADLLNLLSAVTVSTTGLLVVVLASGAGDVRTFLAGLGGAIVVAVAIVHLVTRRRDLLERAAVAVAGAGYWVAARLGVSALERRLRPASVEARIEGYFVTLDAVAENRRRMLAGALFAACGWVAFGTALVTAAAALDISVPLSAALFVVPASGLVGWSPLPGGSGGVEFMLTTGLVATMGIPFSTAAAVTLLYRVCSYWFVVCVDAVAAGLLAALFDG